MRTIDTDRARRPVMFAQEDATAMKKLISVERCRPSGGTFVEHAGLELAVFLLGEPPRAVVIDNACPHASGNLSGGLVEGNTVDCPWHHWKFDLGTGVCTNSDLARVRRYATEIRAGWVWFDPGTQIDNANRQH